MLRICDTMENYLSYSYYIDWKNPNIIQKAKDLLILDNEVDTVKRTYHFVRDEIKHSWDIQDRRVTARASDVLQEKVGI